MDKDYFEKEKNRLWEEVIKLKDVTSSLSARAELLEKSIPEEKLELEQYLDKAKKIHGLINTKNSEINSLLEAIEKSESFYETEKNNINGKITDIAQFHQSAETYLNDITQANQETITLLANTQASYNIVIQAKTDIESELTKVATQLNTAQNNTATASNVLESIKSIEAEAKSNSSKILALLNTATSKNEEIHNLYEEIIGYEGDEVNKDGTPVRIEGLKDKLEKAYESLELNFIKKNEELNSFIKQQKADYATSQVNYEKWIEEKQDEVTTLQKKIKDLMPEAMAAGLSEGYLQKKLHEQKEKEKAEQIFFWSILGMGAISLIIIFSTIYLMWLGKSYIEVIELLPRIAVSIVPLYIPAVWFGVVANKKINLSKRLIEEYAHKEALAKTFVGLSDHVEQYCLSNANSDLKAMLLINMVNATAENPGKLLKGYGQSDSPIEMLLNKFSEIFKRNINEDLKKVADD